MLRATFNRYRAAYAGLPREVWMLALVLLVNRCGTMVLPFMTLYLTGEFGMTEAAAGWMIGVYGLGAVCGAYLSARLTEPVGAIRLQTTCMFLSVPGFMMLPLWSTWGAIATNLFFLSLVSEAVRPANATSVAKLTNSTNRTRAYALHRLAGNLGFSFGPAIGGVLATINYNLLFFADALTTLLAALAMVWFFRLRRIAGAYESAAAPLRASPLHDRAFLAFLGLVLASSMVFFQFATTYPLYLRDHYGLTKPMIGLMFAVNTTVIVAFEMLLVDSIKRWPLLRTIGWGSCISCLGFGLLPFGVSAPFAVCAMLVLTIGEMLSMPLSAGFVANRSQPGAEGAYMGWYTLMLAVASVLGPVLGSLIYQLNRDALWYGGLVVGAGVLVGFRMLAARVPDAALSAGVPEVEAPPSLEPAYTSAATEAPAPVAR